MKMTTNCILSLYLFILDVLVKLNEPAGIFAVKSCLLDWLWI